MQLPLKFSGTESLGCWNGTSVGHQDGAVSFQLIELYKNSRFFVDRFHWRGHIGCSKGYCLDSYKSLDSARINSQINEQANSGLQRIKGQLAYMKPENFILTLSVFLAVSNKLKVKKLDLSGLSISN